MPKYICELWIDRLVVAVPRLRPLYDDHHIYYGGLLPHVFLGDVTRLVTQGFARENDEELHLDGRSDALEILRILEEAVATGDPDLMELVSVSFLENINWAETEGQSIRFVIGPRLREELLRREYS